MNNLTSWSSHLFAITVVGEWSLNYTFGSTGVNKRDLVPSAGHSQ